MEDFSKKVAAAALVEGQSFYLPNFGTLEGIYIAAKINHVEKEIESPKLDVEWKNNSKKDTPSFKEILVWSGATSKEAETYQDEWVNALNNGEDIEIGDLGILKGLDTSNQQVQFIPNHEALSKVFWSSNGVKLPQSTSKPKQKATPVANNPAENTFERKPLVREKEKSTKDLLVRFFVGATILLLSGFLIWQLVQTPKSTSKAVAARSQAVENSRLNQAPAGEPKISPRNQANKEARNVNNASVVAPSSAAVDPASLGAQETTLDFTEGEIQVPVIIGSFGNQSNVVSLEEKLKKLGFDTYQDQANGMTRVGALFSVQSQQELDLYVQQMRAQFNPKAWVLE